VKLREIASLLNGEIIGPPHADEIEIKGVSGINDALEGDITFLASERFAKYLPGCRASCVMVKEPIPGLERAQLKVPNPHLAFSKLLEHFYIEPKKPLGISTEAFVSEKASTGKNVSIFPLSYISDGAFIDEGTVIYPFVFVGENTTIGKGCIIYPNVVVREKVTIGNNVIIHSGSVIGSDGFGYVFDEGKHYKIPQVGGVIIEDDVEIGSNVSIDRATTGNTIIGRGTKIDNLVQIAHNVKIGKHCIIVGQVGIAGSTEIGDYVTLGGQVGVVDHVKIGSGTMIGAQSGVISDVSKGIYTGSPIMPHREWLKSQAIISKLPELYKRIREIEKKMEELERRNPA